jgi:hypothetical protein
MPYRHEIRCLMSVFPTLAHILSVWSRATTANKTIIWIFCWKDLWRCNRKCNHHFCPLVVSVSCNALRMCASVGETGNLTSNTLFHGGRASITVKRCKMTVFDQNATLIFCDQLWRHFSPIKVTHTKTLLYTKWPARRALSDGKFEIIRKIVARQLQRHSRFCWTEGVLFYYYSVIVIHVYCVIH